MAISEKDFSFCHFSIAPNVVSLVATNIFVSARMERNLALNLHDSVSTSGVACDTVSQQHFTVRKRVSSLKSLGFTGGTKSLTFAAVTP